MSIDQTKLKAAVDLIGERDSNEEIIDFNEDRFKAVRFLKEYAKNPSRNYSAVAEKLGISRRSAENYVERYVYLHMVLKDKNRLDPKTGVNQAVEDILRYYNQDLIKSNVPKADLLNAGEISRLAEMVRKYATMYRILESDSELNTEFNDNPRRMAYNNDYQQTMMNNDDDYDQEYDHDGTPEGILKSLLLNNRDVVNPRKINFIINMFRTNPQAYITNPELLKRLIMQSCKPNGRPVVDSMIYIFHQSLANNGIGGQNGAYGQAGANGLVMGGGQQYQGYIDAYQNTAEARRERARELEERNFNEQLNKMMKLTLMKSLQVGAGGSGGGDMDFLKQMMFMGGGMRLSMVQNPETGAYEAQFVPSNGAAGGQSMENSLVTTLLSKVIEGLVTPKEDNLTAILLPKLVDNMMNKPSLADEIAKLGEVQRFINPQSGPPSPEQLEYGFKEKELEIKEKLLMKDIELKNSRETNERNVHNAEQERANAMMDRIMEGVNTFGEKALPFLAQVFQTGMQNQGGGGQQPEYTESTTPYGGEMVDALNPNNTMAVENEALYGAIDNRMNQFTSDIARQNNETQNQLRREVEELKRGMSVGGEQITEDTNESLYLRDQQHQPVENVADQLYDGYAATDTEQYQQEPQIGGRGVEGEPNGEFTSNDIRNATTEELLEAKKAYVAQKAKFNNFGEMLEQELLSRGTVPDETDLVVDSGNIDPDYIGGDNEQLITEMRIAEKENNRVKSLWDRKHNDNSSSQKEEEDIHDVLDAPDLEDISGEEKIIESPLKEPEPEPIPEDDDNDEIEGSLEHEDEIINTELDPETESKLQNLLQTKVSDETPGKLKPVQTETQKDSPSPKTKKKQQKVKKSKDQAP